MVQRVDDPTLPKPWAKLAEGDTVYYWNEETGVTQYERPALPTSSQPSSVRTHAHAPQRPYITRSMTHTCVRSFVVPRLRYSESMHQCIIIIIRLLPPTATTRLASHPPARAQCRQTSTVASTTCRCRVQPPLNRTNCLSRHPSAPTLWTRYLCLIVHTGRDLVVATQRAPRAQGRTTTAPCLDAVFPRSPPPMLCRFSRQASRRQHPSKHKHGRLP